MPGCSSGTWTHGPTKAPQADSLGLSVAQRLREEFLRLTRSRQRPGNGAPSLTPEDLAKHWHDLAEHDRVRQGRGPLSYKEKQVIALRVSQAMQDMDLNDNGKIDMDEWVHHLLLAQCSIPQIKAPQHINAMLRVALLEHPRIVHDLQRMFEVADTSHTGSVSQDDIQDAYKRRLWRLRACEDGSMLSDEDLRDGDLEQMAWELVEAMDIDLDSRITYAEFMAYCVGRRKHEVIVHMYDLSSGAASSISPFLLGERLGGIWHTGIVVFGKEYYFGGEIYYDTPGQTCFGLPVKRIALGYTLWRQEELHALIVNELKPLFCRESYDVILHNCNHFSDRICRWLTGTALPEEVSRQPEKFMQCFATRAARPLLNRWLVGMDSDTSSQPCKGTESGGAQSSTSKALQDNLAPGMVVAIKPANGHGPSVLGAVMSPRHSTRKSTGMSDAKKPNSSSANCWVRYLSAGGCHGTLCTEKLPCERVTVVRLSELGAGNAAYQAALQAIMGPTLSDEALDQALHRCGQVGQHKALTDAAGSARRSQNGASRGLSPASTMVPESMLEDVSSPRISECTSSSSTSDVGDKLEELAAELHLTRDDLKSLVLEDFLPESWREANAIGIAEPSSDASLFNPDAGDFDGEPLLLQLPEVLQVHNRRLGPVGLSSAASQPVDGSSTDWPPVEWPAVPKPADRQTHKESRPCSPSPEEQPLLHCASAVDDAPPEWFNMEWAEDVEDQSHQESSASPVPESTV